MQFEQGLQRRECRMVHMLPCDEDRLRAILGQVSRADDGEKYRHRPAEPSRLKSVDMAHYCHHRCPGVSKGKVCPDWQVL